MGSVDIILPSKKQTVENKYITLEQSKLWAKQDKEHRPTQDVLTHSLLTGYVAKHIIEGIINPFILQEKIIDKNILPYIASHDYGKLHILFLVKCEKWIDENFANEDREYLHKLRIILQTDKEERNKNHHSVVGANLFWKEVMMKKDFFDNLLSKERDMIKNNILLHHGRQRSKFEIDKTYENLINISQEVRCEFISSIEKEFGNIVHTKYIDDAIVILIRGITIISDWIASSMDYIKNDVSRKDIRNEVDKKIKELGLTPVHSKINNEMTFSDIFIGEDDSNYSMNSLQEQINNMVLSTKDKGSIFLIEDVMGSGKTEAALLLVYKILCSKLANGFYFSFPTQATSNSAYSRINSFISNILKSKCKIENKNFIKLIHSTSFLKEESSSFNKDKFVWFYSNNKKGLMYPWSIGTVDQSLMSIINTNHSDLRYFALSNKVLIIDEIHSYDVFTSSLLKENIQKLRELGCIIIVLSATLSVTAKIKLFNLNESEAKEVQKNQNQYPLITKINL